MARFNRKGSHERKIWALVVACLAQTCFAGAQPQSPFSGPVTLDRKTATHLILAQTKPAYPPLAKVNFIQGKVRLQVLVSDEGKVMQASVVEGHPFLAVAALAAVRHWLYQPFKTAAGAAAFVTYIDVKFALRNTKIDRLPPQPEQDLSRQIRPPEMLEKPGIHSHLVHVRVLVGEEGEVLDVSPVAGFPFHYDVALKSVEQCKFHPARWGPLPVPWYAEVDVPLEDETSSHVAPLSQ